LSVQKLGMWEAGEIIFVVGMLLKIKVQA